MNLVIDVGNTVAKLAVFQKDELLEKKVVEKQELDREILQVLTEFTQIQFLISSNVSQSRFTVPDKFIDKIDSISLSADTQLPFKNLYSTPQTLGNDRKALVAAAARTYPGQNVLVIDAGTCITYDFKNSDNEYLGGAISPGLKMRYKALNAFTANLPLIEQQPEVKGEVKYIGDSTLNSINTGVVLGATKEIDGMISEYAERCENLITIITGGDAHFLSINLKNSIFANSNFLLEGLNYILEFNTSQ